MEDEKRVEESPVEVVEETNEEVVAPVEEPVEEVTEEAPVEEVPAEKTEEDKMNEERAKMIKEAQDLAELIFSELLATSELPFMAIEIVPDFLKGQINIHKGKSKKWDVVNKAQDDFYKTPIKDLEVYESVEESKEEN